MTTLSEYSTELSFGASASYARIAVTKSGYIHAWLGTPMQPEKVARWKPDDLEKEIKYVKGIEPNYLRNYILDVCQSL